MVTLKDVRIRVDRPLRKDGVWIVDLFLGEKHIAIAWQTGKGFGVCSCGNHGYGEGADEVYSDFGSLLDGLSVIFEPGSGCVFCDLDLPAVGGDHETREGPVECKLSPLNRCQCTNCIRVREARRKSIMPKLKDLRVFYDHNPPNCSQKLEEFPLDDTTP